MSAINDKRIPVTILTGFLGSGKTTVLNRLLKLPDLADTAVIVNEFGEVGIDHLLIEQAFENGVLLKNGCICCTVRGDIADTLAVLWQRADAGEIPRFRRIAIETTGLADPAPIAHTLVRQAAEYLCRLDGIVTTVDALHGLEQLHRQEEARNQVALADRILLTKSDLADAPRLDALKRRLAELNPLAPVRIVLHGAAARDDVFGLGPEETASDARVARWLAAPPAHQDHDEAHDHHHHDITTALVGAEGPVSRTALCRWLDSILSVRGQDILRLKGLVRLAGETRPLLLQGVHHVLHPPVWLSARPGLPDRSEIVLITRGLSAEGLRQSFAAAQEADL
jgi:G3E family GTPase